MAKLIIVCVIAMLAVASATFTFDFESFNPLVAPIQEEAMSCPTNTCAVSGGDCVSTATDYRYCPQNEFENTTMTGGGTCNCRTVSQFLAVGASCTAGAVTNQCGPYATCAVATGGALSDYKCYGDKMIGDTCTVGSYECAAPRLCSSAGLCVANLAAGATCYNATSFKSLGMCPMNQYCPTVFTADQVCTAKKAVAATCASDMECPPYTKCGLYTPLDKKCDRRVFGNVATGSDMNQYTGPLSCASYTANYTSGKCVDYDAELAKWNTAFPTPASIQCTTALDCNLVGVYLAGCVCTAKATGSTPYCLLASKPSVAYASQIAAQKQDGIIETAYAASCENSSPNGPEFVNDGKYCASKWASTFLASVCPAITAQASTSFSCYDMTYGLCNGASALQSSVVMTMIVALVAFFTTQ